MENCPLTMKINPDKIVDYSRYGGKFLTDVTTTGGPNNVFSDQVQRLPEVVGERPEFKELAAALNEVQSMGYTEMAAYQQKQAEIRTKYADQMEAYYDAIEEETKRIIADNLDVEASISSARRCVAVSWLPTPVRSWRPAKPRSPAPSPRISP